MALSQPVAREALHVREIVMTGYRREDGLYDIEAHLVDTKTYGFSNTDRGWVEPGVPLHGMWARMTLDDDMLIVEFEASTEFSPYSICPQAAPNFARLAGLRVGRGFVRMANERIGGVHGCTHIREMLGQMGTVAYQTLYSIRQKREQAANATSTGDVETASVTVEGRPANLGTCLAYAPNSPIVKRHWPEHYTGG